MWIDPNTQVVYRLHSDIRAAFPNVSFPPSMGDENIELVGLRPVKSTPRPAGDYTKNVTEQPPVFENGEWIQVWSVTDATPEEINSRISQQWSDIRAQRSQLLFTSDWTQLPDAPVDSVAWASYRQALRDVTNQPDPFDIVWPVQPE